MMYQGIFHGLQCTLTQSKKAPKKKIIPFHSFIILVGSIKILLSKLMLEWEEGNQGGIIGCRGGWG